MSIRYKLRPWHLGQVPVPWYARAWRKVTFAERRSSWPVIIEELHRLLGDPVD